MALVDHGERQTERRSDLHQRRRRHVIAALAALGTLAGALIEGGARDNIMWGYMLGAALMLIAAATEWKLGFAAERRSLEDVATPLSRAAE